MRKLLLVLLFFISNSLFSQNIEEGIWLVELDYNWDKIERGMELDSIF